VTRLTSVAITTANVQKLTTRILLIALLLAKIAHADEMTRQVQEELRRRHLFFNEIDGRNTPDVAVALRRYQERQGFAPTGVADNVTLRSLGLVNEPAPPAEGSAELLPDVPVLRSDSALPESSRESRPVAPPPAATAKLQPITKTEAADFVRRYLAACESPSVHDELGFYGNTVDYYDHGMVDRQYIQNELAVYDQRWSRRKYTLSAPVRVSESAGKTTAKFRVAFEVANPLVNRSAHGRIDETFGLLRRGDGGLQIVSIREQRVRRSSRARRSRTNDDPVVRSVRKAFRSIFHH
jgi:hypothetical protein